MKTTLLITLLSLSLIFSSCKKEEAEPTVITTRVGTVYSDSSQLSTLHYYSPSLLIKGAYDNGGKLNLLFHYANKESTMKVSENGLYSYAVAYFWNAAGLADSSVEVNPNGGIRIRKKYEYDANNFLTSAKWFNQNDSLILIESFSVEGSNITRHSYNRLDSSVTSLPTGTYTYEYFGDKINTISNVYFGRTYLGASSQNALKSSTYTNGLTSTKANYTYHYENGLIASQLIYADSSGANGALIDSLSFSYYIH